MIAFSRCVLIVLGLSWYSHDPSFLPVLPLLIFPCHVSPCLISTQMPLTALKDLLGRIVWTFGDNVISFGSLRRRQGFRDFSSVFSPPARSRDERKWGRGRYGIESYHLSLSRILWGMIIHLIRYPQPMEVRVHHAVWPFLLSSLHDSASSQQLLF